ncbi:rRNA adenine methyltransferase [Verticiella sediminum]|uniref:rRNA adenine methyltransferase n=1 Tax=Verticiella sediminum TaxID=1247510 RepID=A0A556AQ14_9BURK|nr:class II aldolase/adducin family protein [Verticiella sediminum]TSH94973.1 rRNA adenine methyltransferase [Verticiella sediminum]
MIQIRTDIEAERRKARTDLAAAHRIAFMYRMSEGIFNHLTARVPGTDNLYYQIPFGTHWSEVCASTFMEVDLETAEVVSGEGYVEQSAFAIHAPIHKGVEAAQAVFHTHMPFSAALSRLKDPTIRPIGQTELSILRHLVYDHEYTGPAVSTDEGDRYVALLNQNPGKSVVLMANHGVLTMGSIAHAFDRLYYMERVAQVQMYAMWTHRELHYISPDLAARTNTTTRKLQPNYGDRTYAEYHFEALKRYLTKRQPDYVS